MPELLSHSQYATRTNGVHEKRVWTVKRIDKAAAIVELSPSRRLHCAGNLQCQFIKILLALVERNLPFAHQPPEISVSGNVVEAVVMHADVRNVCGHALNRVAPANFEKLFVAGRVELEQRRTV